jgi:hypothetical protein
MSAVLQAAMKQALLAIGTGNYTSEFFASGQLAELQERVRSIADTLRPCHPNRIRAILASLSAMPSRVEDDPANARFMAAQDVADLESSGVPEFALEAAAYNFRMQAVPGKGSWRPTAGDLRSEAVRLGATRYVEHADIKKILAAKPRFALSPTAEKPELRPISRDQWAKLQAEIAGAVLKATIADRSHRA